LNPFTSSIQSSICTKSQEEKAGELTAVKKKLGAIDLSGVFGKVPARRGMG